MTAADPAPPDERAARAVVRAADTAEILATTLLGLSIRLRNTGSDPRAVEICAGIAEQTVDQLPRMVCELADDLALADVPAAGAVHLPPLAADVMPRLFYLYRRTDRSGGLSGTGTVGVGIELPEVPTPGPRVVFIWRGLTSDVWNLSVWQSVDEVLAVHGHGDGTELHWLYRPPDHPVLVTHPDARKEPSIP